MPEANSIAGIYLLAFRKAFVLKGCASRSEFWTPFVVNLVIGKILHKLAQGSLLIAVVTLAFDLIWIIPACTLTVRRLHDTNRSGWNFLWAFLPIIGGIVLWVFLLQKSVRPNRFDTQE